jgi:hypothetical protein
MPKQILIYHNTHEIGMLFLRTDHTKEQKEGCQFMSDQNTQETLMPEPIEQHTTAAWANIEKLKEISNVAIPSELDVWNAKDWVDSNQK